MSVTRMALLTVSLLAVGFIAVPMAYSGILGAIGGIGLVANAEDYLVYTPIVSVVSIVGLLWRTQ